MKLLEMKFEWRVDPQYGEADDDEEEGDIVL